MESSSSGVALTAGEMLAPALAEATAVAEAEGEGAGVGDWPNAVQARAIELRQVKIVVFIVSLGVRCVAQPVWIQKTTTWIHRTGPLSESGLTRLQQRRAGDETRTRDVLLGKEVLYH